MFALILAAALQAPARPPDGTYSYSLYANGASVLTSTITVASAGTSFTTSEQTTLSDGRTVLVRTAYDTATVLPTHYEIHTRPAVVNADLMASITPQAITFNGTPLSYQAAPNAKFIVIGEGLMGYRMMLPWTVLANDLQPFTFAALNGNATLSGIVVPAPKDRPATVPAPDKALATQIGSDVIVFWYNPQTHVTDEADTVSGVSMRLQSYKPEVTAFEEPSAITHVPLAPTNYTDKDVFVGSTGGAVLAGTLSVPNGSAKRYPVVLMVHGSGAETRDGGTQANPTFLLLANALANRGVAVLRYDKRGIGKSTGKPTEDWHPLADDVQAMVAFLKKQRQIDAARIFVLGHSEGGLVVPLVANALGVRGIILMAPPAIALHDILVKQGLRSMTPSQQKAVSDAFTAYDGIDPAQVLANVDVPVLLLQGAKDGQVLASDFSHLVAAAREAHRAVTAVELPDDDHLFIALPPSQPVQANEILDPHPLDPRVAEAILSFIGDSRIGDTQTPPAKGKSTLW